MIRTAAGRFPEHEALKTDAESWSYSALFEAVETVAAGLVDNGLRPGDRVAVYLPKTAHTVIGMFAAIAAGGIVVPINPALKVRQVLHILEDSGA
ncbi:MAG: AMP-binding protein, partial [Alphaproteobacteria bacterium]|nr:AMP-binding protein [Alphaproteobacteria bacterium]